MNELGGIVGRIERSYQRSKGLREKQMGNVYFAACRLFMKLSDGPQKERTRSNSRGNERYSPVRLKKA